MKRKFVINACILFLVTSCSQDENELVNKFPYLNQITEFDEDGDLSSIYYTDDSGKIQMERVYFFKSSRLDSVKVNYKDGLEDGDYYSYYKNGKLKEKANYEGGYPHGWYYSFDTKGKIATKQFLENHSYNVVYYYKNGIINEIEGFNTYDRTIYSEVLFKKNRKIDEKNSRFCRVHKISDSLVTISLVGVEKSDCDSIYVSICNNFKEDHNVLRSFSVNSWKHIKIPFSIEDLNEQNLLSIHTKCIKYTDKYSTFVKNYYLQLDFDDLDSQKPYYIIGLK